MDLKWWPATTTSGKLRKQAREWVRQRWTSRDSDTTALKCAQMMHAEWVGDLNWLHEAASADHPSSATSRPGDPLPDGWTDTTVNASRYETPIPVTPKGLGVLALCRTCTDFENDVQGCARSDCIVRCLGLRHVHIAQGSDVGDAVVFVRPQPPPQPHRASSISTKSARTKRHRPDQTAISSHQNSVKRLRFA